jgi:hypothetical protein
LYFFFALAAHFLRIAICALRVCHLCVLVWGSVKVHILSGVRLTQEQDLAVFFEQETEEEKVEECIGFARDLMDLHAKLDCNLMVLKELCEGAHEVESVFCVTLNIH